MAAKQELMELRGQWVHFRIRDVFIPDPHKLVLDLHGDDLLRGRAIDFSDNGTRKRTYVVVEVERIKESVIVPVDRVIEASMSESGTAEPDEEER